MMNNQILCCDAFDGLKKLNDNSIDICITDPPYFLNSLDDCWDQKHLKNSKKNHIGGLPPGMKFSKNQSKNLEIFYSKVSENIFRVLKPGAFFITFSSPRLYHSIAWAIDKNGFEIRDMIVWQHCQGQDKSFGMNHFIDNLKINIEEKQNLYNITTGWVTPQIIPTFEPICIAQKPKIGNFIDNFQLNGLGLMRKISNLKGTIIKSKPKISEKGYYNDHVSGKPIQVIELLINAFTQENHIVLDPFIGSGTTAIAAKKCNRQYIGFERELHYCDIANRRLNEIKLDSLFYI